MFETIGSVAAIVAVTEALKRVSGITGRAVTWMAGAVAVLVTISWEFANQPPGIDWSIVPQTAILGWLAAMGTHSAIQTQRRG